MPKRKFHPGDIVRISEHAREIGIRATNSLLRVKAYHYEKDEDGNNYAFYHHCPRDSVSGHPYWVVVESFDPEVELMISDRVFWEGFLELDPFLGNAWRAKRGKAKV